MMGNVIAVAEAAGGGLSMGFPDGVRARVGSARTEAGRAASVEQPAPRELSRRSLRYWQELFIYAWVIALLGSWYEIGLSIVMLAITGDHAWWRPTGVLDVLQFAEPYGLGTIAVIAVIVPLKVRHHLRLPTVFMLNTAFCGAVEVISAQALVLALGSNPFWDYSRYPLAAAGTSSASVLVFGLFATLFVYFVFPVTDRAFAQVENRTVHVVFWVMVVLFLAALAVKLGRYGWLPI